MTTNQYLCLITFALLLPSGELRGQPTLAIALVPKVSINAQPGTVSAIQYSITPADSNSWVTLTTLTVTKSPLDYIDPTTATLPQRYYRAVTISTNAAQIDMVWIPAGTFTMGSPSNEVGHLDNEGPQTTVSISRGFWIGRYEVTQTQITNVMGPKTFSFPGTNSPAEGLSWTDAIYYCALLTEAERRAGRLPAGYVYRLPSEAEWECAARAGTTTRYYFGDDTSNSLLPNYAWYTLNAGNTSHSIGVKLPNLWGLYDVEGNLAEWCLDRYAANLPGGLVIDPFGPATGTSHVVKGGSFIATATQARSAIRWGFTDFGRYNIGFRVVLGPPLQ